MIRSYQSLQYNWFPKGHQRKIPTYGRHQGAKLFGVLNYETREILYRDGERYDAPAFIQFLDTVLKAYPTGKIVMILDNGKIARAQSCGGTLEMAKERRGSQCILQEVLSYSS